MVRFLPLFLLLAASLGWADPPQAADVVGGEVIVRLKTKANDLKLQDHTGRMLVMARALTEDTMVFRLADTSPRAVFKAIEVLKKNDKVAYAAPNRLRTPFMVPNDLHYPTQWYLKSMGLEEAWEQTTGSESTVVAVIDTGILADHPDLQGRLLPGRDFISTAAEAGDGDGWDGDPRDEGTADLTSSALHGTHVAGIIGALSNNGEGVTGVNWACKILPVRVLGIHQGKGADADIAAGIRWAAGLHVPNVPDNPHPAQVINLSFGGPGASPVLTEAVLAAEARGTIVVAAAGNHNEDAWDYYPAAIPQVITVGAIRYDGRRAPYSNYGTIIDIMAPGGSLGDDLPFLYNGQSYPAAILSTTFDSQTNLFSYRFYEGTSQAAPVVVGVISLMLAIKPTLTSNEALDILRASANPTYQCYEGCGAGLVDAAAALAAVNGRGTATLAPAGPALSQLPLGSGCARDEQCAEGRCLEQGSGHFCTLSCSAQTDCPGSASCSEGKCLFDRADKIVDLSISCVEETCNFRQERLAGGCSLAGQDLLSEQSWGIGILVLLLLLRRRRPR